MLITLFTDASFCPQTKAGGWACWIKYRNPETTTVKKSGEIKQGCTSATGAELAAMANGLYITTTLLTLTPSDRILLKSDCLTAIEILNGLPNRLLADEYISKLVSYIRNLIQEKTFTLQLRHVKGHRGKADSRAAVNTFCDKEARKHMENVRKRIDENEILLP